jgi:hypothetical protein
VCIVEFTMQMLFAIWIKNHHIYNLDQIEVILKFTRHIKGVVILSDGVVSVRVYPFFEPTLPPPSRFTAGYANINPQKALKIYTFIPGSLFSIILKLLLALVFCRKQKLNIVSVRITISKSFSHKNCVKHYATLQIFILKSQFCCYVWVNKETYEKWLFLYIFFGKTHKRFPNF